MERRRPDPPGVVEFCRALHPQLVGTLTVFCGDRPVAEELAQETLVRVWNRWASVSTMENPAGWAHHVALNLARSAFRRVAAERRAYARLGTRPESDEGAPDPDDLASVRQAVGALPPRQRAVIAWRYFAGFSVEETAVVLGCAPGTVKSLTAKATATLRRRLALVPTEAGTS
jgi:RNA polymerase sigma factor (sigma-70 family)